MLLDLPDFDSIQASHRLEAERIVALADLVLWVVEPQKYADASLHDRYLRPLATHAEAMAVVLNQADLLAPADVAAWRADMEALLSRDGVPKLPLLVVSALRRGVPELRRLLTDRVAARDAALAKLAADLEQAVAPFVSHCEGKAHGIGREDERRLLEALEDAAGVPAVLRAVGDAHRRRGALATGWPFVRWLKRFKPDPLRRLRLPESPQQHVRTSMPPPTEVQRAQVASAARRLADGAATGLPQPWPRLVREAATAAEAQVADRLDRAVAGADLSVSGRAGGGSPACSRPCSRWPSRRALSGSALSPSSAGSGSRTSCRCRSSKVDPDLARSRRRGRGVPALLARLANGVGARRRPRARDARCGRGSRRSRMGLSAVRSFTSSRSTRASVPWSSPPAGLGITLTAASTAAPIWRRSDTRSWG